MVVALELISKLALFSLKDAYPVKSYFRDIKDFISVIQMKEMLNNN